MKISIVEIKDQDVRAVINVIKEARKRLTVPKNDRDTVGIVVAIDTETQDAELRLHNDLITEFRNFIDAAGLSSLFKIISYPPQLTRLIRDPEQAKAYLIRSRGHLIVFGQLVQRGHHGKQNHVLKLRGYVRHAPVTQQISDALSREFSEMLPQKVAFETDSELLGFELTSQWLGYAVNYVVALAAFISGDLDLSHRLFVDLKTKIEKLGKVDIPIIDLMRERLPNRIAAAVRFMLMRQYFMYSRTRERKYILESKPLIDELRDYVEDDYQAHLMCSMYHYFQGEVDEALAEVDQIPGRDATWRFSKGFLLAFKNDTDGALDQYRRGFYGETSNNVINDVDVFLTDVIEEHPEMARLLFFRGLINYKGKPDYELAKNDFEAFLASSDSKRYEKLTELATKYLDNIRANIGD